MIRYAAHRDDFRRTVALALSAAGLLLAAIATPGIAASDQAAQSDSQTPLSFEVASIKPYAVPIGTVSFTSLQWHGASPAPS